MKIRRCRVGSYRRVGRRALVSRAGDERDSHPANPGRAAGRYVGRVLGSVEQSEDGDHGGRPGLGGSRVYKGAIRAGKTEITVS